jgi:hypothetical protein
MAVDGLIQTFRALDPKSRSHALAALLRELTAQEWRDLKLLAGTKTLQCDIVGRLPVELVLNIFSFLDIAVLCRLQTVRELLDIVFICRTWSTALCQLTQVPGI